MSYQLLAKGLFAPDVVDEQYRMASFIEANMYAKIGQTGLGAVNREQQVAYAGTAHASQSCESLANLLKLRHCKEDSRCSNIPGRGAATTDKADKTGKGNEVPVSPTNPVTCVRSRGQEESCREAGPRLTGPHNWASPL